jgi:DNA-binding NtrC family response regulator
MCRTRASYGWPGDVRELINRVRRAIVMSEGRQITARDLELEEHSDAVPVTLAQAREALDERDNLRCSTRSSRLRRLAVVVRSARSHDISRSGLLKRQFSNSRCGRGRAGV